CASGARAATARWPPSTAPWPPPGGSWPSWRTISAPTAAWWCPRGCAPTSAGSRCSSRPNPRGVRDHPSPRGVRDHPSPRGVRDRPSPRGVRDRPSPRGVRDRPSPRGARDQPIPRGVRDGHEPRGGGGAMSVSFEPVALRDLAAGPETLAALDIDGTILQHNGHVADPVRRAVQDLAEAGTHVVLATGRSAHATVPVLAELGLRTGWAVCSNGAVILRLDPGLPEGHEFSDVTTFDPEPTLRLLRDHLPE